MGSLGDISPGGSIAIGIIVGLLSTSVQSLGLTLQRKSHILEDEKGPHDVRRPPHRRRRWQLGMGMFIIANLLGSTIQITTLPLPVLSTLQASGLVFNSICATLILAEPFTTWSIWGTALVCTGAVLIAIFGAIPSPAHSLDELLLLLGRWPFVLWMSLQGLLVVSIALAVELTKHLSNLSQNSRFRFIRGLAYGCISGILSAHSLLVAKSAVELIVRTIADGDNQFKRWQSWVLVLGLVTLALSQLYYLHRGLKLVSTSVLYPLVFCIYNIIAILDGLIYFNQTNLITPLQACLITLGTVILLSGVLALSWRLSDEQHQPAVGQSSLAPGLGLIEDTEGEEEESLLDVIGLGHDEESMLPSYNTFEPSQQVPSGPDPSRSPPLRRKSTVTLNPRSRWGEHEEIWGELEDQETPTTTPLFLRNRSRTLPGRGADESTALLSGRRNISGSAVSLGPPSTSASAEPSPSMSARPWRRRRRSTGFPGFAARRSRRKSASGLQDAMAGFWRLRWLRGGRGKSPPPPSSPQPAEGSGSRVSWSAPYRDEPASGEAQRRRRDGEEAGDGPRRDGEAGRRDEGT